MSNHSKATRKNGRDFQKVASDNISQISQYIKGSVNIWRDSRDNDEMDKRF